MIRKRARLAAAVVGIWVLLAAFFLRAPAAQAPASGTIAVVNARIIDGTGRAPLEQATLIVTNGRVEQIGSGSSVKIPSTPQLKRPRICSA